MQLPAILEYFLPVSVYFLLIYNFLATTLSLKKELYIEKKSFQLFQKILLVLILIGMISYYHTTIDTKPLSIIPWIWGFLAGHIFIKRKKPWLNELLGLGILLAITIILFFKQTEIIQLFTTHDVTHITTTVYVVYITTGFILGSLLWFSTANK